MSRDQTVGRQKVVRGISCSTRFVSVIIGLACCVGLQGPEIAMAQDVSLLNPVQQFDGARRSGDLDAAIVYGREAVALMERQYGDNSLELAGTLENLAAALVDAGATDDALRNYSRSLQIREQVFGPDHPELVPTLEAMVAIHIQAEEFDDAESLLVRILDIETSVYGQRHENVTITWNRLRDVYVRAGKPDEVARVDAALAEITLSTRDIDLTIPGPTESLDGRRYGADEDFATVRVFYGTNRARTGKDKATQFYGAERGDLETGYLDVSIPASHKYGELERASRWSIFTYRLGETALKKKYILLLNVQPLDEDTFEGQLHAYIQDSPSKDVFLFVHGYNSSFSDAALRTAQLAYDLDFDGTPMMFSWPSQGSTTGYTVDEAVVRVSGRKMADFMTTIVDDAGADRIHLIAHSMGNRALIEALQTWVVRRGDSDSDADTAFDQIVFTAPDVDRDYFVDVIEPIRSVANRITLYTSENDLALKTSAMLHGAPRAGLAGESTVVLPGIDTIDMSAVKADSLGHTYFAANEGAIYDLFSLLWRGDSPDKRCGMRGAAATDDGIWRYDSETCRGEDVLEAGMLLKRFGRGAIERVRRRLQSFSEDKDEPDKEEWTRILKRLEQLIDSDTP